MDNLGDDAEPNSPSAIEKEIAENLEWDPRDLGDGQYYVAPDSAGPIPASMWDRIDPEAPDADAKMDEAVDGINSRVERAFKEGGVTDLRQALYWVSPEERQLLEKIGGPAARDLLDDFDKAASGE